MITWVNKIIAGTLIHYMKFGIPSQLLWLLHLTVQYLWIEWENFYVVN